MKAFLINNLIDLQSSFVIYETTRPLSYYEDVFSNESIEDLFSLVEYQDVTKIVTTNLYSKYFSALNKHLNFYWDKRIKYDEIDLLKEEYLQLINEDSIVDWVVNDAIPKFSQIISNLHVTNYTDFETFIGSAEYFMGCIEEALTSEGDALVAWLYSIPPGFENDLIAFGLIIIKNNSSQTIVIKVIEISLDISDNSLKYTYNGGIRINGEATISFAA